MSLTNYITQFIAGAYYLFPFRTLSGSVLWIYVEFAGWFCTLFVASTVLQMVVERT